MKKQQYVIGIFLVFISSCFALAQEPITAKKWSLQDCINYAYENNLNLLRNKNNVKLRENAVKQSKFDRLPIVNGSTSWNNGYGRTVDYTTMAIQLKIPLTSIMVLGRRSIYLMASVKKTKSTKTNLIYRLIYLLLKA